MAYCTLTDIQERIPEDLLIQLTDDADDGAVNTDQVDAAIERSDAEIDTWCGARYRVPFAPVPAIIREMSADIAAALIHGRRGTETPEAVKAQAKAQRDLLRAIATGTVTIGGADLAADGGSPAHAEFTGSDCVFTRDALRGGA